MNEVHRELILMMDSGSVFMYPPILSNARSRDV